MIPSRRVAIGKPFGKTDFYGGDYSRRFGGQQEKLQTLTIEVHTCEERLQAKSRALLGCALIFAKKFGASDAALAPA